MSQKRIHYDGDLFGLIFLSNFLGFIFGQQSCVMQ